MKCNISLLKRNTTYLLPLCLFIADYFMIVMGISFAYEARKMWMFPPVADSFSIRSIYIYLIAPALFLFMMCLCHCYDIAYRIGIVLETYLKQYLIVRCLRYF